MPEFAVTTLIHRPVTELFAYFADPTRRAEWSDHVIAGRWLTPAPVGVGSIYEITTCQWGRTVKTRRRVTVFAPEREFTYEINSPLLYVLSRQQFEAAGDNTRYSVSGHGRLKGFARLVGFLAGQFMSTDHIAKEVADFKRALEDGAAATGGGCNAANKPG